LTKQKSDFNKLRHIRRQKETQLKELAVQVRPDDVQPQAETYEVRTEAKLERMLRQIEREEDSRLTYEHMRRTRATTLKTNAGAYRDFKQKVKEVNVQLRKRLNDNQEVEKELEMLLSAEQQMELRMKTDQQDRDQRVRTELKRFKGGIEFEAFSNKTRTRRRDELQLAGQERKMELLEQAYKVARKAEVLELKLEGQKMVEQDIKKKLIQLKKVTLAETPEAAVDKYDEVVKRWEELRQMADSCEAEVEGKKTELKELIGLQRQQRADLVEGQGDLVELETKVMNRESACKQQEADLERISTAYAQMSNFIQQYYNRLKRVLPGYEDTKLTPSRLKEIYDRMDLIMKIVEHSA
jgi:hypothetical protein